MKENREAAEEKNGLNKYNIMIRHSDNSYLLPLWFRSVWPEAWRMHVILRDLKAIENFHGYVHFWWNVILRKEKQRNCMIDLVSSKNRGTAGPPNTLRFTQLLDSDKNLFRVQLNRRSKSFKVLWEAMQSDGLTKLFGPGQVSWLIEQAEHFNMNEQLRRDLKIYAANVFWLSNAILHRARTTVWWWNLAWTLEHENSIFSKYTRSEKTNSRTKLWVSENGVIIH